MGLLTLSAQGSSASRAILGGLQCCPKRIPLSLPVPGTLHGGMSNFLLCWNLQQGADTFHCVLPGVSGRPGHIPAAFPRQSHLQPACCL